MEKFSKILKELRVEKNLSISTLSKQVGISSSALSRWELGQADIRSRDLVKLAKFYNVTTDHILGLED